MMPTKTSVGPKEVVRLEVLRLAPPLKCMTGRKSNPSKKLKPFVDPQIWPDLEEPVKEALRGLYAVRAL
jgi:hypothetical protein